LWRVELRYAPPNNAKAPAPRERPGARTQEGLAPMSDRSSQDAARAGRRFERHSTRHRGPEPLLLVVGVHQCPGGLLDPAEQEGDPPVEVRVEPQLVRPVSLGPGARSQESSMSPSGKTILENASSR